MIQDTKSDAAFSAWLLRVDAIVSKRIGLGIDDIDDFCYRDAFEDGSTPAECARDAIRAAAGLD